MLIRRWYMKSPNYDLWVKNWQILMDYEKVRSVNEWKWEKNIPRKDACGDYLVCKLGKQD
jgi:hypothetical protein